jgi:hypothetical protein
MVGIGLIEVILLCFCRKLLSFDFNYLNLNYRNSNHRNLFQMSVVKKPTQAVPEFSRILNVNQVQEKRKVLCRLLAKDKEREKLAQRFDIPEICYLSANVTVSKVDSNSISVEGNLEGHIKFGEILDIEVVTSDFETLLLNNQGGNTDSINFDFASEFDDEVDANGDIDVGEIVAQYLALELY